MHFFILEEDLWVKVQIFKTHFWVNKFRNNWKLLIGSLKLASLTGSFFQGQKFSFCFLGLNFQLQCNEGTTDTLMQSYRCMMPRIFKSCLLYSWILFICTSNIASMLTCNRMWHRNHVDETKIFQKKKKAIYNITVQKSEHALWT